MTAATSWMPFIDPLYSAVPHLSQWWFLGLLPLLAAVAVVYRAVRLPPETSVPKIFASALVAFLVCLGVAAAICIGLVLFYHVVTRHLPLPLGALNFAFWPLR